MFSNELRDRLRAGEALFGTFVKTPSHQVVELLCLAGLDFVVLDAEHAPLDRADIDRLVLAARSGRMPCLVRVSEVGDPLAQSCLDVAADGLLFPRILDAPMARSAVAQARFRDGTRGYSPSTRSARYGSDGGEEYVRRSDLAVTTWCQIEDALAVERVEEIAAVDGVDCLFVGRADLAISLGARDQKDPAVDAALVSIARRGRRHGIAVGVHYSDASEIPRLRSLGITVFVCGSDQSWLVQAAKNAASAFRSATTMKQTGD